MNVYDEAHNLARAIKESNEHIEFENLRKQVESDPNLSDMLKQLHQLQFAVQTAQMTGQTPDENTMKQFQSVYTMLSANPTAAQYMQAEAAFSVMINDIFTILGDAMGMK